MTFIPEYVDVQNALSSRPVAKIEQWQLLKTRTHHIKPCMLFWPGCFEPIGPQCFLTLQKVMKSNLNHFAWMISWECNEGIYRTRYLLLYDITPSHRMILASVSLLRSWGKHDHDCGTQRVLELHGKCTDKHAAPPPLTKIHGAGSSYKATAY